MPSKSKAQQRLMDAVAHGWHKPGGGGPTKAVAKEFVQADKKRGKKKLPEKMDGKSQIKNTRALPKRGTNKRTSLKSA